MGEGTPVRGLYALKPWYARRLRLVVEGAVGRGVSPDTFTLVGVLAAAAAGVAIWRGAWPAAAVLLAARLAGANLDGAVARRRGVARPWGFVLNEVGDRLADLLMFGGLYALASRVAGSWTDPAALAVVVAALAATLPTAASLAAAGAGGTRHNGGPVGKTERCALAVVATAWPGLLPGVSAVIALGSLLTAAVRLRAAHGELAGRGPGEPGAASGAGAAA
jgi:CDP-diacylglycerol--glycerol-3-phosphate 3-phosphatidyltransferase